MSQRGNNFKGNRHTPYQNRAGWKDRRGDRERGVDQNNMISIKREQIETNDHQRHEDSQESVPLDPNIEQQLVAEKAKREKKFGSRSRLYVGNLLRGTTEAELRQLFSPFGETGDVFMEKERSFAFIRMAYRSDCEEAIAVLNGRTVKGRELRVRFAASNCSVKVHNLHHTVSNELLAQAFSGFGEVEFAAVMTDDRGKSLGYGVIDFAKKSQAFNAIEKCRDGCFILTRSPIPVTLTELKRENEEGLPEKLLRNNSKYEFERDSSPRMAVPGTPEYDFAMRWKNLYNAEAKVRDEVEGQLKDQRRFLEGETDQFHHLENATILRQQLLQHQREQMRLEERLRRHEDFLKTPGALPLPPPPAGMPLPPPMMGSFPGPPPQPLLAGRLGDFVNRNDNPECDDGNMGGYPQHPPGIPPFPYSH